MDRVRLVVYPLLIGFMGIAAWYGWRLYRIQHDPGAIPSAGGRHLWIRPDAPGAFYLQGDPAWAGDGIGGSGESIRFVGCTLCAIAMASTDLGHAIDPGELNAKLKANGGYNPRGLIIWSKVAPALDGHAEAIFTTETSHQLIDDCLERGDVPIVKIFLPGGIPHWVPVVGKAGKEYLVKDSSYPPKSLVKLSDRGPQIHSVRFVRRK